MPYFELPVTILNKVLLFGLDNVGICLQSIGIIDGNLAILLIEIKYLTMTKSK